MLSSLYQISWHSLSFVCLVLLPLNPHMFVLVWGSGDVAPISMLHSLYKKFSLANKTPLWMIPSPYLILIMYRKPARDDISICRCQLTSSEFVFSGSAASSRFNFFLSFNLIFFSSYLQQTWKIPRIAVLIKY